MVTTSEKAPLHSSMNKREPSPLAPFVKWFFPKLLPFIPRWMTPNMITAIGIVGFMLAGISLALASYSRWFYLLGASLILFTWVTDTMDGIVARDRQKTSRLGYYLDHYGDSFAVIFIGLGMYWGAGSHVEIGMATCILYLLLHCNGHIKVVPLRVMEHPAFGPTEMRLLIISAIVAQIWIDYGKPLSWFPSITGDQGWLTQWLGFQTGLTFLDVMGLIVCTLCILAIPVDFALTVRRFAKLDREQPGG